MKRMLQMYLIRENAMLFSPVVAEIILSDKAAFKAASLSAGELLA